MVLVMRVLCGLNPQAGGVSLVVWVNFMKFTVRLRLSEQECLSEQYELLGPLFESALLKLWSEAASRGTTAAVWWSQHEEIAKLLLDPVKVAVVLDQRSPKKPRRKALDDLVESSILAERLFSNLVADDVDAMTVEACLPLIEP